MAGNIYVFTAGKDYHKALSSFCSRETSQEITTKWYKTHIPDIIRRIRDNMEDEPFRVLAVGTGDGDKCDIELLNILSKFNMKVHYTVVEPRLDAVEILKDSVKSKYENTQFEWLPTTFEVYQDSEWMKDPQRFDFIHFIHSLYYIVTSFENLGARLRPCYEDMLKSGGSMMAVLNNQSQNKIFSSLGSSLFDDRDIVGKLARLESWKHEYHNMDFQVDLTECFDDSSETGGYILDFLTRTHNFRQIADKDSLNKMMKQLEEQSEVMEDGRKIATRCNMDITIIWKN